jgi:hypothetical protein
MKMEKKNYLYLYLTQSENILKFERATCFVNIYFVYNFGKIGKKKVVQAVIHSSKMCITLYAPLQNGLMTSLQPGQQELKEKKNQIQKN